MYLSIGVTGHRDLLEEEKPALESRVRAFFGDIRQRYPGLNLELLSPLASGSDQLVASVALQENISLVAVLPMGQSEYEKDFESDLDLVQFRTSLAAAKRVIDLPIAAGNPGDDTEPSELSRNRQYAQLGLFISNHCQILLALWDGKESQDLGGTSQVVHYHLTAVMPGFEDHHSSAHLLADNENDLVYHVVCSRQRNNGSVGAGLKPLDCYWITSQAGRVDGHEMPSDYAIMLDRLEEFEADRGRLLTEQSTPASLLSEIPGHLTIPAGAELADRLFGVADHLAVHFQKRVNRSLYALYLLAVSMGLVFILYSEFALPQMFLWVFLALFLSGVVLHITGNRHQWHRKYLDYRALAEALRVQFYWNLSGVVETRSVAFAYENFLQKQDVELSWIRHVMRSVSLGRSLDVEPSPEWVPWVIEKWVGSSGSEAGQLSYYSLKEAHNTIRFRRNERLGVICLWAGVGATILLAAAGHFLEDNHQRVLLVLMGILPLIAGISDSISHKKAEKELIKQYRFMARIFTNARSLLDDSQSIEFQRRVLKALGEAALEEGAEWILMHRARPLEHQGLA